MRFYNRYCENCDHSKELTSELEEINHGGPSTTTGEPFAERLLFSTTCESFDLPTEHQCVHGSSDHNDTLDWALRRLTSHGGAGFTVLVVVVAVLAIIIIIEITRNRASRRIRDSRRSRRQAREILRQQTALPTYEEVIERELLELPSYDQAVAKNSLDLSVTADKETLVNNEVLYFEQDDHH